MKKIQTNLIILLGTSLLFAGYSFKPAEKIPAPATIAVIVNNENTITALTVSEAKLYYLRKIKTRWPDINKNIRPVDHKASCAEQATFYSKVLGMSADEVETYFLTKQYQSAQKPQDKFSTDREIIEFVSQEIGAIGYVNINSLSVTDKTNVKVVLTVNP